MITATQQDIINQAIQILEGTALTTLEALASRPCALAFTHEHYQPPTQDEVRALIALMGWSQNDVAKMVGVNYNPKKGSATVRRWKAKEGDTHARAIPYAAWRLMLIYAGVVQK
ncbi:hypothetical protein [Marinagarivorans algicola]|uniref:hypothetical protein n=1 Tax=Marinagarivorans algicola TaxID=1513270 RepID=UPI0006B6870A|nr:hypothetical protein [Marinagarivorans algicola]